jgi:branched-chain amino acid transport system permease protein
MDPIFHTMVYGGLYGLVAVGFNVLYRPTNVFNFAQGQFVAIGALLAAALLRGGVPWLPALAIALVAVGVLSVVVERLAVAPVLARSALSHTWLITTLAVSLILDDLAAKIFGGEAQPVSVPSPFSSDYLIRAGDAGLSSYDLLVIVVPVLVLIGLGKLYGTRPGRAIAAIAEDRQGAVLRGIDPILLTRVSWFVGGGLAALAGVLAGPIMYASVSLGPSLLITGFAAVAIGGVGDNRGAMAGGYLLALVEGVTAARIAPDLTNVATFAVLLVVLLVKPTGIFGERRVARV